MDFVILEIEEDTCTHYAWEAVVSHHHMSYRCQKWYIIFWCERWTCGA